MIKIKCIQETSNLLNISQICKECLVINEKKADTLIGKWIRKSQHTYTQSPVANKIILDNAQAHQLLKNCSLKPYFPHIKCFSVWSDWLTYKAAGADLIKLKI